MEHDDVILQRELARLREELQRVPYGSVSLTLTIHAGKISRVVRGSEISEKPGEPVRRFNVREGGS